MGKKKNSLYLVQVLPKLTGRRPIQKEIIGPMFPGVTEYVMMSFTTVTNHISIYLSSVTIKETMVEIWYMFSNIHQDQRKNPKIMKKNSMVAERTTNNYKYRHFPISPYLSSKGQPNLLYDRIWFSDNVFRSWPNWTKWDSENVQGTQKSAYISLVTWNSNSAHKLHNTKVIGHLIFVEVTIDPLR